MTCISQVFQVMDINLSGNALQTLPRDFSQFHEARTLDLRHCSSYNLNIQTNLIQRRLLREANGPHFSYFSWDNTLSSSRLIILTNISQTIFIKKSRFYFKHVLIDRIINHKNRNGLKWLKSNHRKAFFSYLRDKLHIHLNVLRKKT